MSVPRPLPSFFTNWRSDWKVSTPYTPTDFLNQQNLLPGVIMAGWLYCPELVEYRGGIFLSERFTATNVDSWLKRLDDDLVAAEKIVNHISLADLFTDCDLDGVEDALPAFATSIARCWDGVIRVEYPDRQPIVMVDLEADLGPTITFHT